MDSEKHDKNVESNDRLKVDYVVYEGTVARLQMIIKWLIVVILVLVAVILIQGGIYTYERLQYDYADYEVTADGGAEANYANLVGGEMDGDIYNGGTSKNENTNEEQRNAPEENESQG